MGVTKLFLQIHRIYEGLERIILLCAVNLKDILRLIGGNLTRFKQSPYPYEILPASFENKCFNTVRCSQFAHCDTLMSSMHHRGASGMLTNKGSRSHRKNNTRPLFVENKTRQSDKDRMGEGTRQSKASKHQNNLHIITSHHTNKPADVHVKGSELYENFTVHLQQKVHCYIF